MKMILYAPAPVKPQSRVTDPLVGMVFQKGTLVVCRTINELTRRLRAPKGNLTILVLLFASREDMLDALNIRHLFRDVRLIVVAPDLEDETIALAHRLRPRYLTYRSSDFSALSSVVAKISEDHERQSTSVRREAKKQGHNKRNSSQTRTSQQRAAPRLRPSEKRRTSR